MRHGAVGIAMHWQMYYAANAATRFGVSSLRSHLRDELQAGTHRGGNKLLNLPHPTKLLL